MDCSEVMRGGHIARGGRGREVPQRGVERGPRTRSRSRGRQVLFRTGMVDSRSPVDAAAAAASLAVALSCPCWPYIARLYASHARCRAWVTSLRWGN